MKKKFLLHAALTDTPQRVFRTSTLSNFMPGYPKVAPNAPPDMK